jgi:hypothetical protein
MKSSILIASLLLTAAPALAANGEMSAAEFEAYTRGKTFYYGSGGAAYGAEEYLSDRRVRWTFLDGQCQEGIWYEDDGLICFVYDNQPDPQCWSFRRAPGGGGLIAQFENDPAQTELYEVRRTDEPLVCPGPEVGV